MKKVDAADHGTRLDVFVSAAYNISRTRVSALVKAGHVAVNGIIETKPGYEVRAGMRVECDIPEPVSVDISPQYNLDLPIIYEDDDLAVVAKPSGMVVHPAAGNMSGTMVNALLARLNGLSGIGGELRPGIVHRIDKDTSGLLLVAKNDFSHISLSEQLKAHTIDRVYMAIVQGRLSQADGSVNGPIGRHPVDRKRMAIVSGGREAVTHYHLLSDLKGSSLIEARLTTGRTHQIRVHMASIGHPVLGDSVYGPKKPPHKINGGQLLHAYKLGFVHPRTGQPMSFEMQPEQRFAEWLKRLSM